MPAFGVSVLVRPSNRAGFLFGLFVSCSAREEPHAQRVVLLLSVVFP